MREPGIQSAFNIDSNPISWISIFVIYFLRRRQRRTICTAKEGVFRGSTPMHTDVASSSIKFRAINNPVFVMIHSSALSRFARRPPTVGRLSDRPHGEKKRERWKLFGYSYQLQRVNELEGIP